MRLKHESGLVPPKGSRVEAVKVSVPEPEPTPGPVVEPNWVHHEIERLISNEVSQRVRRITAHQTDGWKARIKAILDSDLTPLNMLVKIEEEVT